MRNRRHRHPLLTLAFWLAIMAILAARCYAQPVVRIKQTVQTCSAVKCLQQEVGWSGTVVGRIKDGRVAVLTCAHALKVDADFYKTPYVEIDGAWLPGKWKAWHPQRDVGLVVLATDARIKCLPIAATDAAVGSTVTLYGFAHAQPAVTVTEGAIASATPAWLRLTAVPQQGMSGGPVVHDGQVSGLITGYSRHGFGAWGGDGPTLAMVRKTLVELVGEVPVCGTVKPAQPEPTPIEPEPQPPQPERDPFPELRVLLDRIDARLEALEKREATPGPAGPAGPQGPPGAKGDNASAASLEARLKKLEATVIPVELIDDKGNVESMKVKLGDPIRLRKSIRETTPPK